MLWFSNAWSPEQEQFECDQLFSEEAAAQGGDHFLGDLRGEEIDERNLERRFGRVIVIVIGAPLGRGRQVVGKDNRREDERPVHFVDQRHRVVEPSR